MKNFKKKIALLCVLTLVLSCIAPVMPGFAATNWYDGFTIDGNVSVKDGIVTLGGNTTYEKNGVALPSSYVATATIRVPKFATNCGVYLGTNSYRTGLYINEGSVRSMAASPANYAFDIGNTWHDYRFHVDGASHKIYIDNKLVVSGGASTAGVDRIQFWMTGDGILEIEDLKIQYEPNAVSGGGSVGEVDERLDFSFEAPAETEYAPEFTVDWADPETYKDWTITNAPEITMNKETGILNINTAVEGSRLASGPRRWITIERAPLTPANFDLEFDLQMVRSESGSFQFRAIGAGTHNYYFVRRDRFTHNHGDATQSGGQMMIGDEWHHWKIEQRGNKQTLFMDGKAYHDCNMNIVNGNAAIRFCLDTSFGDYDVNLGKIHYKPYFPEVELTAPANNSSYVEGSDIVFTANPETKVDYIDYYLDGVNIGRGYAPDYKYVFKTSKVGAYEVAAGVGGKITQAKNEVTVVKGFTAELKLNKTEAKLGETVNASIKYDSLTTALRPTKVEYFVDGNKVGTSTTAPFNMLLKDIKIGTSQVEARIYNNNGAMASDTERVVIYDTKASSGKLSREYEIDYNYGSGNGVINITDGYYKLDMKHGAESITYETYTGTETYALGKGKYKVAVISGIAEVYYNGQYAFSFYMPRATENKISYSGISNFRISGNGTKVRYLSKKWDNKDFEIGGVDMPYYFNVEFDKKDASDEKIVVYDGEHKIILEFKDGKIQTDSFDIEKTASELFVLNGEAKAGYYKLVCNRGLCQLYIDNQYVDSFKSVPQAGMTRVQRKMSNPSSSTILEIKGIDDIYYHDDDFNGNTEVESLEYWLPDCADYKDNKLHDFDYWLPEDATISASIESKQMKLEGTGTYVLNAQTHNTDTKWRAKVESGDEFYIGTRMFSKRHFVKAGYDFKKKTWFIQEYFDMKEYPHPSGVDVYENRMTFKGPALTKDEWHDFELHTEGDTLVLKMDGKVVIETDKLQSPYYGYIGIGMTKGLAMIDNFSYTGECGAFAGIRSRVVSGLNGRKVSDFVELSDGKVIGHYYSTQYSTTDGGETWKYETGTTSINSISHTLKNGTQLKFEKVGGKMYCFASTDDCKTWEQRGLVEVRPWGNTCILNGSLEETSDGTIFVGNDESFSEWYSQPGIFYSKDEGKTWHEADMMFGFKTGATDSLHTYYTNIHIEEMTFEELPDEKTVRCFARTGHGFVYYMDSTDGGKTWGQLRPTQLINPLVTYNIEQDLNDPNVYYAVTMYSANTESYHENDRNRSRQALFKSFDGMKTWEFVGTLSETVGWNNPSRANTATKAYGDTLYISDNGNSEDSFALIYAIDPAKLKTKKRHESPHTALIQHRQENIGFMQFRDRFDEISFLPETSGRASIYGSNFDITVKDGMYDAETIGKVFGAQVVKSGKTVTFKIGEGAVKFTEGSKDYVVNGETKSFALACMKNGYFNIEACAEAFERQYEKYEGMNVIDLYNE